MGKIVRKKNQYVVPVGNGWAVKGEGAGKFTFITDTKKQAITYAKSIAINNNAELFVYDKTGKVSDHSTFAGVVSSKTRK